MKDSLMLKCPTCNALLKMSIAFDGIDWETEAGKDSGYDYPLSLDCTNSDCGNTYTLGRLNSWGAFSKQIEKNYL